MLNNIFLNKKILIIADFNPNRSCGITVHLNYLKHFFEKNNLVKLQTTANLSQLIESDIIWFRSEKGLIKFFLVCLILKKTMVYDMSSFAWLELQGARRSWFRVKTSFYIYKIVAKIALTRVLSFAMKDYLLNHFTIKSERLFVFNIPIEIRGITKRLRSDNKIHFIYVGSNKAWQGLPNLIKALNQIESESDFILHCYGVTNPNTKNIIFHKDLPHDQLIQVILRDIDVVVVPRERNEITEMVMPIKYAEAIYLNKYILATDLKVLHEIENEKVIFVKNNEVDTLINAIRSFKKIILENPSN